MFYHIGFPVRDAVNSRAFYTAALAPLGIGVAAEFPGWVGFGKPGKPRFWLGGQGAPPSGAHIAFAAVTRADVDAVYHAAIAAGGRDNGGPGLRPDYHANYYGAFVLDPDGHNVEAVCHSAQSA
jgi:catechol 2,3-dioxygenase-like lactoylglutathione lyase family enzyme